MPARWFSLLVRRFPHTRGGGPFLAIFSVPSVPFSPHAWGWTIVAVETEHLHHSFPHTRGGGPISDVRKPPALNVFPTRVGVDLKD